MIINCSHCSKPIEINITNVLQQRIERMIETFEHDLKHENLTQDSKVQHFFAIGLLRTLISDATEIVKQKDNQK